MKKVYKKLTKEQKERSVIFSSTLSRGKTECKDDTTHEVFIGQIDGEEAVNRLLDDAFFNASYFKYNIIRK